MENSGDGIPVRGQSRRCRGRTKGARSRVAIAAGLLAILAALLLSSGCVTDSPGTGNSHPAPKVLVEYSRTGGIAAFDDRLVVFDNGQTVFSREYRAGEFTIPPDQLSELGRLLEDADFPSLAPSYPAPSPGADYFYYTLTYGEKTVTAETGGVPDALIVVIERLDALLADYAPLS